MINTPASQSEVPEFDFWPGNQLILAEAFVILLSSFKQMLAERFMTACGNLLPHNFQFKFNGIISRCYIIVC
jgi:hypothetical protein